MGKYSEHLRKHQCSWLDPVCASTRGRECKEVEGEEHAAEGLCVYCFMGLFPMRGRQVGRVREEVRYEKRGGSARYVSRAFVLVCPAVGKRAL